MNLNWKKPWVYVLAPILVFLAFVGFPPPFAPARAVRAAQEQSEEISERASKQEPA